MSDDVLGVFKKADEPVLTAADVAEELGASRKTANERLQEMAKQGKVNRKVVGARAVVYWLPGNLASIRH